MEEMNSHIIEIIDQHQTMKKRQKAAAENIGKTDKYGYAFEYNDSFASDPLGFTETTMQLQIEAGETFRIMSEINRHSPLYFQMSVQLEKLISLLGSACITRAVLEQQKGQTFAILDCLTIDWLRGKAAFNFRKCFASFMESQGNLSYNAPALNFSIRWAALDRRLQATAEKIEKIKAGKIRIETGDAVEKGEQPAAAGSRKKEKKESEAALREKGRSFSIDKTALPGDTKEIHAETAEKANVPAGTVAKSNPMIAAETERGQEADLNREADGLSDANAEERVTNQEHEAAADKNENRLHDWNVETKGSNREAESANEKEDLPVDENVETKGSNREAESANEKKDLPVDENVETRGSDQEAEEEITERVKAASSVDSSLSQRKQVAADSGEEDDFFDEDHYIDGDDYIDGDEDNLPYVSEDLVRRMSEMIHRQEALQWPFPVYEFSDV